MQYTFDEGQGRMAKLDFRGIEVPIVQRDPRDNSLYAVVEHGHFGTKLHRSQDNGETWEEITTPAYPPKPEDAPEILCPFRKVEALETSSSVKKH